MNPQKMFVLQTYNNSNNNGSTNAPVGIGLQQTEAPYGTGSISGTFAVDLSDLTATYTEALMRMTFDGAGTVDGIADISMKGVLSSVVLDATYTVPNSPNSTTGRGTILLPAPLGANNYVFYLVNSQNAFLLGLTPDAEGSMTMQ